MALKTHYGVTIAVVLCGAVTMALLPPERSEQFGDDFYNPPPELRKRRELQLELASARTDLQAVSRRDSVLGILPTASDSVSPMPPRLLVDDLLPHGMADTGQQILGKEWHDLGVQTPVLQSFVVLVSDPARVSTTSSSRGNIDYLVPGGELGAQAGCIAIVRVPDRSSAARALSLNSTDTYGTRVNPSRTLLGPCAYYAAYGRPGPRIEKWLRDRGFDIAINSNWSSETMLGSEPGAGTWGRRFSSRLNAAFTTSDLLQLPITSRACWLNDADACLRTVLETRPNAVNGAGTTGVFSSEAAEDRRLWRGYGIRFLADMHHAMGPERFAQFWKSPDAPAVAFEKVMQVPLGRWTNNWVTGIYGQTVAGAKIPLSFSLAGLLVVSGCVVAATVVAGRRQVR